MAIAFTLIVKMVMAELVADDFAKDLLPENLVYFRVEIKVSILGKETTSSSLKT